MSDRTFLDTNIIVYSFDESSKEKQAIANNIIQTGIIENNAVISYQVVQEFINVATRKFKVPLTHVDCKLYVDKVLTLLWEVYPSRDLIHFALDISEHWHYSFYDSLIIAAAIESSCSVLYTEDLQHRQQIYSLKIINPFI